MSASIVDELTRRACARDAKIVYPEPADERIREAAMQIVRAGIAEPVLVGRPDDLPERPGPGVAVQPADDAELIREFAAAYVERRHLRERVALRLVRRPLIFGAMMVAQGRADGMVAGISSRTASVIQAATLAIGYAEGISTPSSCFIMVVPRLDGRENVPLIFADCAVNIAPTAEQLAETALAAADSARRFLGVTPRVAMLSFSTRGSAGHALVSDVRRAAEMAAARIEDGFVEGEFQLDAAVSPDVAARKTPPGSSEVAGRANVLIFPDLNAGNIAYKATQYLGGAQAIGPVLQGFARPVNDLSRGASVADVVAITAVTVLQG